MSGELFERIRAASAAVVHRARWVRIDRERLASLAERHAASPPAAASYDTRYHHRGPPPSTLAFVLTLDTINFGSGFFPHLRKRAGFSGYFTIASGLKRRFDDRGAWSAAELTELDAGVLAELFEQDLDSPEVAELLGWYARALNDLGVLLLERYAGRFEGIVEEAGGRAEAWVQALARMPFYRDVARYEELEVPFYKRAQLAAFDLSLAFEGRGTGFFHDLDRLTAFADNLLPHVLRLEGVLAYDPELGKRIEAGEEIAAGSPPEVEIRAAAVHAVELLVEAMRGHGVELGARELDHALWHRGQRPEAKAHPRHRTRSVFY